ncbi:MAG: DUF748 domain-containing protein [Syntrophorhabdaceae bacterium]|nr:DUF748 domain-containing protein [Syntrophorhabdaceae bacterium]
MGDRIKRKHALKKAVLWVIGFFIVFSAAGFFVVPPIARSVLLKQVSAALHRDVSIKAVRVNPYTLSVTIQGFIVKERAGTETFLSFDELYVNAEIMSLFRRALIIRELRLSKPYVRVVRNKDESYNFTDMFRGSTANAGGSGKSKLVTFSVNNITVLNGSVDFIDSPKDVKHTVRDMRITVPFISNRATHTNIFVKPEFSATINGDPYSIKGQTKPFAESLETYLDLEARDVDIPEYLSYIPATLNFKLPSGSVDVKVRITFRQSKDKMTALSVTGDVAVRKLVVNDVSDKPVFRAKSLDVGITLLEPYLKTIKLSNVTVQSPEIIAIRDKNGSFNISELFPKTMEEPEKQPQGAAIRKKEDTQDVFFSMDRLKIEDGRVTFKDLVPSRPVDVSVQKMDLTLDTISTEKDNKGIVDLSLIVGRKGSFTAKGTIGVNPLSGELAVNAKSIRIAPFQRYFNDRIRIYITGGGISSAGKVTLAFDESGTPKVRFAGNLLVSDFSSVDQETTGDFLKWKALSFGSVNAGYNPTALSVNDVSISDFYTRIIIYKDSTANLQRIFSQEAAAQDQPAAVGIALQAEGKKEQKETRPSGKPAPTNVFPDVIIGNITLQGGAVDFTDMHVQPTFSANLTELGGKVSRFILGKDQDSKVEVRGKINQFIPLQIAGRVNPAKDNLLIDLTGIVRDFEMTDMTPYSGKYIGYAIEKGKLSLDLKYSIKGKRLDSQNVIFLDQLTLGDEVESPDAVKAPVKLAIALLKDRSGQIKLDIPVSGSIDDPQFRIGPIIWKVIKNLIVKAATAPFALIGALFGGGGEQLSYIEFDYGSAEITDAAAKKIEIVTKALYDRPALTLDIEGYVSPEEDKEGLRRYLFMRKVKAQKLRDRAKRGREAPPVDEIKIEPEEYERYLGMAYKAEKFAKPRNIIGLAKDLPVSEMEKLMITNIDVTDADLRQLASQRAQEARNMILKTGKVEPARIFVLDSKSLGPEKKENVRDSRVDFKLR